MRLSVTRLGLIGLLVSLPLASGQVGCGHTACFAFSPSEYAANANSCPAQSDALASFTSATCPGPVVSVDGAGSYDGELCCYPVSEDDIVPDCGQGGTGTGGGPNFMGCSDSCDDLLNNGGADGCTIPSDVAGTLGALQACANTNCGTICPSDLLGSFGSAGCFQCLSSACQELLMACEDS